MSKIHKILTEIASNGASKNKLLILTKNKNDDTLKRVFYMAYCKRLQYGIKKYPAPEKTGDASLDSVLDFLEDELATRKITGNAAIAKLVAKLETISEGDQDVVYRVIKRDLSIGASGSSANKVWKKLIPEQPQMLASSYSDKTLKNIKFPAYAQLKADGARCFLEVRPSGVFMVSRSGKEYQLLNHIAEKAYKIWERDFSEAYPDGIMIDGELVSRSGDSVASRTASNGLANKSLSGTISPEESSTMKFEVWDLVDIRKVYGYKVCIDLEYDNRLKELEIFVKNQDEFILIETTVVNNLDEARVVYNKYIAMKLEGIILKNIKSLWEDARSKNLVKFKEIFTIDLEIVDSYPHSKDPNKIGGLTCKTSDGVILVDVGSGLTDTTHRAVGKDIYDNTVWQEIPLGQREESDREALFTYKDKLPGRIIECECNGYLFSKDWKPGETISIFLGVFKKFRQDKDKANSFEDAFGITFEEAVKHHEQV